MSGNKIVLACALALLAGCTQDKAKPRTEIARSSSKVTEPRMRPSSAASADAATPAIAPAVPADKLAGQWQLAIPRHDQQKAKITLTDPTHVTIEAGQTLSGEYVVQGNYLLILTHDERLRPLAWRINSPDSLTVVRPPGTSTGDVDYVGATLVRAAPRTAKTRDQADDDEAAASFDELYLE